MNKKIKNATALEYNGIKFKSKTEVKVYKTLLQYGFKPKYEYMQYVLWEGFKPTISYYTKSKDNNLQLKKTKLISITYTPDFYLKALDGKTSIFIEVKGYVNDVFPIKRKLFLALLEKMQEKEPVVYFEIYTLKQLLQAINIINKDYGFTKDKGGADKS